MFRRKKQNLTRDESLAARPVRNVELTARRDDDGNVVLSIPRRSAWWANALARLLQMPDHKKVSLDEVGTAVWDQCDGKHTVRSIIEEFVKRYQLNRREAEVSMFAYLKELTRRGFIGLVVDEQRDHAKRGAKRRS